MQRIGRSARGGPAQASSTGRWSVLSPARSPALASILEPVSLLLLRAVQTVPLDRRTVMLWVGHGAHGQVWHRLCGKMNLEFRTTG